MNDAPLTLESIDPDAYPHPVADWRDASAYPAHGDNPMRWAWEFTRRDRLYQLCVDTWDALPTHNPDYQKIIEVPAALHAAMRSLPEWEAADDRNFLVNQQEYAHAERARAEWGDDGGPMFCIELRRDTVGLLAWTVEAVLSKRFGIFGERPPRSGTESRWRNDTPVALALNGSTLAHRPPWPLCWPGEQPGGFYVVSVPEHSLEVLKLAHQFLPMDQYDREVLGGDAVGTIVDHALQAAYPFHRDDEGRAVTMGFDLSANIGAQLDRARETLEGMQQRAGFGKPERAMPVPPATTGVRILRYLDWQAEGGCEARGAKAAFKRAIGLKPNDPKAWRRLHEQVEKYTADPVALVRLR